MEIFAVLKASPQLAVQDQGRPGYRSFGVPPGGAVDDYASRLANLLVGNDEAKAVLEITFQGPHLEIRADNVIALCGADMPLTLNGEPRPLWESFPVSKGDRLKIGQARRGLRAYLAFAGGIQVPLVLGSHSTYIPGRFGGFEGRVLAAGDVLRGAPHSDFSPKSCPAKMRSLFPREVVLRALAGPQDDWFGEQMEAFFGLRWEVTPLSDRMGVRLLGPPLAMPAGGPPSIISEPCLPGAVQIVPDGLPIILLREQTSGGYAKIVTVISVDLAKIAQVRPGDVVIFARATWDEARRARAKREKLISLLSDDIKGANRRAPGRLTRGADAPAAGDTLLARPEEMQKKLQTEETKMVKAAKEEVNINIFKAWCKACGICAAFCPAGVLTRDEGGHPIVAALDKCSRCGLCEIRCPDFAITVELGSKGKRRAKDKGEEATESITVTG